MFIDCKNIKLTWAGEPVLKEEQCLKNFDFRLDLMLICMVLTQILVKILVYKLWLKESDNNNSSSILTNVIIK